MICLSPPRRVKGMDEKDPLSLKMLVYLFSLPIFRTLVSTASAEISPVCAILGGFLAQDILKTLSGKDAPLLNYFLYNGLEGKPPSRFQAAVFRSVSCDHALRSTSIFIYSSFFFACICLMHRIGPPYPENNCTSCTHIASHRIT